jgi:PTS system nitrogen regulatory IIA component
MQLTVRDVAEIFHVSESAVYRWIADQNLPAEEVNGQYHCNRAELLEWATIRRLQIPPRLIDPTRNGSGPLRLDEALAVGGVHYHVLGSDKAAVLQAVIGLLPLPADVDRDFLLQIMLSREASGSTAIGDGLALPHPRYPVVLPVPKPLIALCFLDEAIVYGAKNDPPVHTLFCLVCPTVHVHLQLLARLGFALRDPAFREIIRQRSPAEVILQDAQRVEKLLQASGMADSEGAA